MSRRSANTRNWPPSTAGPAPSPTHRVSVVRIVAGVSLVRPEPTERIGDEEAGGEAVPGAGGGTLVGGQPPVEQLGDGHQRRRFHSGVGAGGGD